DGDGVGGAICDAGAYEVGPPPNSDYGDAPDTYQTLFASDGPRHELSELFLGAAVDEDFDGQPGNLAILDDDNGLDDEDGVVIASPFSPGSTVTFEVTASGDGFFSLWLDLDQSGDFLGEQLIADAPVSAGVTAIDAVLPAEALLGVTFMRSRLDSAGGLDFFGAADDGEVEDDLVIVKRLADLAVTSVAADRLLANPGGPIEVTATVTNLGPDDVTQARITSFDTGLTFTGWTCAPTGGAACPASGAATPDFDVDLPVGAVVTVTASATVDLDAPELVIWRPRITTPATADDPVIGNDFLFLERLRGIFGDDFESGTLSAWSATVP
ncbi:MAG: GEVED domain-containing protein, partial [Acidobacteriota bacterium]